MLKKILFITLLAGIVLTACGGQSPDVTEIPTIIPTTEAPATNTPAITDTPPPQESFTPPPTATEFVPDNPADCTNSAAFVSDITIPDNTEIAAGEPFTKTWRIRNTGTCIWWAGYILTHYSESAMGAPEFVQLPLTNPGDTADLSVDLIAPNTKGDYRGNFVIKNPAGLIMQVDNDSRLWLIIKVPSDIVATGTSTPTAETETTVTETQASNETAAACDVTTDETREDQVATIVNNYRAESSLVAYTVNPLLAQAAQRHANDMACNQFFVHDGSDGSTPTTRVADTGYAASYVTENVYGSYPPLSAEQVVTWWKLDQTDTQHNKNLISTQYTEIGVGYAYYNNFGYYVIVFASP